MLSKVKLGSLLLAGVLACSASALADTGTTRSDAQIQAAIAKQFQKSEFQGVRFNVQDGVVTLTGTVDTYRHKLDAEKKARKADHVKAVRDELQVAGFSISDTALEERLARSLRYDRYGYGSLFNVLFVNAKNGVVTLSGEVRTPIDRDSALAVVAGTPGVKDVVDKLKVAPTSIYDDELRIRLARAIYGDEALSGYALDPQAPIRILVDNGHVALYGAVDSKMDSQIAFMRASQVFGAFSVENHLTTPQRKIG